MQGGSIPSCLVTCMLEKPVSEDAGFFYAHARARKYPDEAG